MWLGFREIIHNERNNNIKLAKVLINTTDLFKRFAIILDPLPIYKWAFALKLSLTKNNLIFLRLKFPF